MRRLGLLPMMYQPGERWLYNMSCDLMGVLVARPSGRSFSAFLDERLFGPLGMKGCPAIRTLPSASAAAPSATPPA